MVKIAIAGGAGNVGQEVIDALLARNKHEILILSRKDAPENEIASEVTWAKTNYQDIDELAKVLEGVHTVLSFMSVGPEGTKGRPQENLIDASVKAGVKRFAPSEWASSKVDHFPWYDFKRAAREYLAEINKGKKVIEYTLFHFGLFTNYMTFPYKSSKHVTLFETPINFNDCRGLLVDDGEAVLSLITAQDAAKVTALAVEHEGEWPLVSGIKGANITMNELVALGEKIRGKTFKVDYLKSEDLEANVIKASYLPMPDHPSIPVEIRKSYAATIIRGLLLGFKDGAMQVSDEWNKLLPDYKFTQPEEFLTKAWEAIDAGQESIFTDY
ncbi:2-hydroxyisoflavone reductase [Fusarium heterosporum]|uniref:2-hydroxyisoflavone reductase n=1 Tax=Fusarium heterosporum TaxID=42747 RepID=A0A8H5WNE0_FUSHE|nr:2-hydroxyisoflavone reductase [Fusarium heterosporum]